MSKGGRPRFRSYVHAHVVDSDLVVLLTESGIDPLQGRLNSSLASFLDGTLTVPEIIAQVDGSLDAFDVIYGVDELRRQGHLIDAGEKQTEHSLGPLAESLGVSSATVKRRLRSTSVGVQSLVPAGAETLEELLRAQGLQVRARGDFTIVVTADYLDPRLGAINRDALRSERPWMLVKPTGSVVWIGPVFRPNDGACWQCLAAHLRRVRAAWGVPESAALPLAQTELAPAIHAGMAIAALEAAKWVIKPGRDSALRTFDAKSLQSSTHAAARLADCDACGSPPTPTPARPLVLKRRKKTFTFDGGHRSAAPEETWERYAHLVSPLVGLVHSVERVPVGRGSLVNVYAAQHNFGSRPRRSLGKGMTDAQSRTGALCEALERYSGMYRGDEPVVRSTFRRLGEAAVHPNACLGYSERQYAARDEWNERVAASTQAIWVGEPFDERRAADWAPAWSLTHETHRYVAAAYCYYGYPIGENRFCQADSNGNAAGSSLEDAVLQGLLELVERDAVALWWYSRCRRGGAELQTAYGDALAREYAAAGRTLWLLDLTSDLGIPVFAAVSRGEDAGDMVLGFGAHLDPLIAASRALTEMNQPLALRQGRKVTPFTEPLADDTFLQPDPSRPVRRLPDAAFSPREDLRADVTACVNLLRRNGLETLVVDQTRREIGLPVVKVIVPGLRHFRPRFAPGRLYDVPPRLGWVERPLSESELNPSHLTI